MHFSLECSLNAKAFTGVNTLAFTGVNALAFTPMPSKPNTELSYLIRLLLSLHPQLSITNTVYKRSCFQLALLTTEVIYNSHLLG